MERRAITIQGIVQGVGFRPFVYGLADRHHLAGFVRNQAGAVVIEVEGESPALDDFLGALRDQPPPLARIDNLQWRPLAALGERRFQIVSSAAQAAGQVFISPDVATCDQCVAELFDPADRRFRYPFLNCTNCGPRLTIIEGAPYDRARTTMARFPLCPACRAEYEDPRNRRFHAQPNACPACGPRLELRVGRGGERERGRGGEIHIAPSPSPPLAPSPLAAFVAAIRAGQIGALKGLGGYHLVCDATSDAAVETLRRRKAREEKPLAVMLRDLDAARRLCAVSAAEAELLASPRRPIVLLGKRSDGSPRLAASVSPGNPTLGLMLPYTPLHHLLMEAVGETPLVMTSGNASDEPIAYDDADAAARLGDIADVLLAHNRPIRVRCDDSVTRVVDGAELPLRRSRGYAPQPVRLPTPCDAPILATGGQLKATFALGVDHQAFLSHHLGDLDHYEAAQAFERDIKLYEQLFGIAPRRIAHDMHPDYASTRYAQARAAREGLELVPVQHHHAHLASCLAENGFDAPAIGVTFDGTGYGLDGAVWGGEFLIGDCRQFRRAAHLRYVGMPGGERAIREPWRMAAAHLLDADCGCDLLRGRVEPAALRNAARMLQRGLNSPPTSSAGRLFDAVAGIAGLRDRATFEGQAAMELEWAASACAPDGCYPWELEESRVESRESRAGKSGEPDGAAGDGPTRQRGLALDSRLSTLDSLVIDTRPLSRAVAEDARRGAAPGRIARRFHDTLAELVVAVCERLRQSSGLSTVALSGGVFLNALLLQETSRRLRDAEFQVYRHRIVPPGDGGLSLGQLAVASQYP